MKRITLILTTIAAAGLAGCDTHTQTDALIGGGAGAVTGALIGNEQDKQDANNE